MRLGLTERAVQDMHTEYGELCMSVEVVDSLDRAVEHIHKYGR